MGKHRWEVGVRRRRVLWHCWDVLGPVSPGRLWGAHHPSGGLISSCPGVAWSWGRAVLNQVKLWGGREYRELSIESDVLSGGLGALLWGRRGLSGALVRAPGGAV